jgi:hypothetical protein
LDAIAADSDVGYARFLCKQACPVNGRCSRANLIDDTGAVLAPETVRAAA